MLASLMLTYLVQTNVQEVRLRVGGDDLKQSKRFFEGCAKLYRRI